MTPAQKHVELQRRLGERLQEHYAGKWVAIAGHEVIASADTEDALHDQAERDGREYRSFQVERAVALL